MDLGHSLASTPARAGQQPLGTISHALIEQAIDHLNGNPGVPKGAVVGTARQNQLAAQNKVLALSWLGGAASTGAKLLA